MTLYLDSSAAVKLVWHEPETVHLLAFLASRTGVEDSIRSCHLAETELRRAATRKGVGQEQVTTALNGFDLIDVPREMFHSAGLLPGSTLRSLDALHIAVALRTDAEWFVTYDQRQAAAARSCGLQVASPDGGD